MGRVGDRRAACALRAASTAWVTAGRGARFGAGRRRAVAGGVAQGRIAASGLAKALLGALG